MNIDCKVVEQEPVAWMSPGKERLEFARKDTVYGSHTIPLYTAPQPAPAREPLTDEEILDLSYDENGFCIVCDDNDAIIIFARRIEVKLKEKNA